MRVGLNLLFLIPGVVGGTESYASGLISGLARAGSGDEFLVYLNRAAGRWSLPNDERFRRVVCACPARPRVARYAFEQLALPRIAARHELDLLHSLGYVAPWRLRCPSVVSIHDTNFAAHEVAMSRLRRAVLRRVVGRAAARATRVLTLSEFSKSEIRRVLGVPGDRIDVVYPSGREPAPGAAVRPPTAPVDTAAEDDGPTVLAFSSSSPHKNVARLVEAFATARAASAPNHRLVVVGHPPGGRLPASLGAAQVEFLGHVSDETVEALMAHAQFLVFPSLYEGFGLPVVEAMKRGLPVACSSAAALPEVAGGAALLFDPGSVESIAAAIGRMAGDSGLRRDLAERGRRRAEAFSWDAAALATIAAYGRSVGPSSESATRGERGASNSTRTAESR